MPINIPQLELDRTGTSPNNKIVNEVHVLDNKPVRIIVPNLAPFFVNGLELRCGGVTLTRGVQYQVAKLHQQATLEFGKELYSALVITDSSLGTNFEVDYQSLGWLYTNNINAIATAVDNILNDTRPVDWSNVKNKPTVYDPTHHLHLLDDLFGFESVSDYLERIKEAIVVGRSNVLFNILDNLVPVIDGVTCETVKTRLPNKEIVTYDALLYILSRYKITSDIWVDTEECVWFKGRNAVIDFNLEDIPSGTDVYWEFYTPNTEIVLSDYFTVLGGTITSDGQPLQQIIYPVPNLVDKDVYFPLYIGLKKNPLDDDYTASTFSISIKEYDGPVILDSLYPSLVYGIRDEFRYSEYSVIDDSEEERLLYLLTND